MNFGIISDLWKNCKGRRANFHVCLIHFPFMLASPIVMVHLSEWTNQHCHIPLTKVKAWFRFYLMCPLVLFSSFQDRSRGITLYSVVMSPQSPLVYDSFLVFLYFTWLWQCWGIPVGFTLQKMELSVRLSDAFFVIRLVGWCLFFLGFFFFGLFFFWGGNATELKCPSRHITSGSTWCDILVGDVNFNLLVKVVSAGFLHFLYFFLWMQITESSPHSGKVGDYALPPRASFVLLTNLSFIYLYQ